MLVLGGVSLTLLMLVLGGVSLTLLVLVLGGIFSYAPRAGFSEVFLLHTSGWLK